MITMYILLYAQVDDVHMFRIECVFCMQYVTILGSGIFMTVGRREQDR